MTGHTEDITWQRTGLKGHTIDRTGRGQDRQRTGQTGDRKDRGQDRQRTGQRRDRTDRGQDRTDQDILI